jgi:SAM-dependent methyltransferase
MFVCDRCGLAQLPSADVDAVDLTGTHGHGAAFSSTVRGHLSDWADRLVSRREPGSATAVLDVASGEGALLRPFFEHGSRVVGLEPNAHIAASAAVPTVQGVFGLDAADALVRANGQFDLVLVNHALAHATDLDDFIAGLARALRPGGLIAIEFIHSLSLVRGQFDVIDHAHRSYVSLHALGSAMARHGLAIVDAEQIELHGGSVRAIGVHAAEGLVVCPGVRELLALERACGLDKPAGYRGLAASATQVKRALKSFLARAAAEGASVAAYGAPNRGTTLLNYCEITSAEIPFTVDRSPAKQGRFLPGCHLPVLAPEAMLSRRPDYVLILPWPLSQEIVGQMSAVRDWGGKFLVAVPELRILHSSDIGFGSGSAGGAQVQVPGKPGAMAS